MARRDQCCGSHRIAAGEQDDLVSSTDEFFGQGRDDSLRAAVEFGGDTLGNRRDLSNPHLMHLEITLVTLCIGTTSLIFLPSEITACISGWSLSLVYFQWRPGQNEMLAGPLWWGK
jgi:hypothetical protein